MGDQKSGQAQHEGRFPPRHCQQEIPGRREQQGRDQPSAFTRDRVGQRRDGQQHRRQRLDRGLKRELTGEFGPRRHPQRRDDEEHAVTGADDRSGHPQQPGSRECVRCPHVRWRGKARRRRHPAEGTGQAVPFQLTTDGGAEASRQRFRDLPRRPVHPDVRTEDRTIDGPAGPIPIRVYWPPTDCEATLPVVVFSARRRMVGRRPRHLRRGGAQPRGRGGRGGGVGGLPAGTRTSVPRRGRRCLGRNAMGGRARARAGRRPGPAGRRGRLGGRQPRGGGGATGARRRRAAYPVPAAVVSGDDVGHVAAVVHRERERAAARRQGGQSVFPVVRGRFGSLGHARHAGSWPSREPGGPAPGVHRRRGL